MKKKWAVLTYEQQERRKRGHEVSPEIIEAESRIEAKRIFVKKYPHWLTVELSATPIKESEAQHERIK